MRGFARRLTAASLLTTLAGCGTAADRPTHDTAGPDDRLTPPGAPTTRDASTQEIPMPWSPPFRIRNSLFSRISPGAVRRQRFTRRWRGVDAAEVRDFLHHIATELTALHRELTIVRQENDRLKRALRDWQTMFANQRDQYPARHASPYASRNAS